MLKYRFFFYYYIYQLWIIKQISTLLYIYTHNIFQLWWRANIWFDRGYSKLQKDWTLSRHENWTLKCVEIFYRVWSIIIIDISQSFMSYSIKLYRNKGIYIKTVRFFFYLQKSKISIETVPFFSFQYIKPKPPAHCYISINRVARASRLSSAMRLCRNWRRSGSHTHTHRGLLRINATVSISHNSHISHRVYSARKPDARFCNKYEGQLLDEWRI